MKVFQAVISTVILFDFVVVLPVKKDNNDGKDTKTLYEFASEAYRLSKNQNGNAESKWNKTSLRNLKKAAGGDIQKASSLGRSGLADEYLRWTNGTVPYLIIGPYDATEQEIIKLAMETIELWSCVRFVPYNGEQDYLVIEHRDYDGCHSFIGCLGKNYVGKTQNVHPFTPQTDNGGGRQVLRLEAPKCFQTVGTPIHELLHALGVIHEHTRLDRDMYINITKQNVHISKLPTFNKNFGIFSVVDVSNFGVPYDYNSIMHYSAYASTGNGQKTIEPTNGEAEIGQRHSMSVRDAVTVMMMYNCYYKIDYSEFSSRILPNAHEITGVQEELWNTYFRDFKYP